jgi:hypothetical protein
MNVQSRILNHWQSLAWLGLFVGLGLSAWWYGQEVSRLETAAANLVECQRLATQIAAAQQAPQRASLETWSQDDLGTAVETAASESQLPRDRVLRIDPQSPRRLGKSDYLEQATEVEFSAVTLRQLVDFLFVVQSRDDQLEIGTLRLRVPHGVRGEQSPETWLADVILTQRIYDPTTPRR